MRNTKPKPRKKSQFFVVRDHANSIKLHKTRASAKIAAEELAKAGDNGARIFVGRLIAEVKTVKQFEWV